MDSRTGGYLGQVDDQLYCVQAMIRPKSPLLGEYSVKTQVELISQLILDSGKATNASSL